MVADVKRSVNVVAVVRNLVLSVFQALCQEVVRLDRRDGELDVVLGNFFAVKRMNARLVRHSVDYLVYRRVNTRSIALPLTILKADTKFYSEPVDSA